MSKERLSWYGRNLNEETTPAWAWRYLKLGEQVLSGRVVHDDTEKVAGILVYGAVAEEVPHA